MIKLTYNGQNNEDFNIKIKSRPSIQASKKRYTEVVVPGRDGTLHKDENSRENIRIDVYLNFIAENYMNNLRKIRRWLSGKGQLSFSYDEDYFYNVVKIEFDPAEIERKKLVNLTVHFECEPYMYIKFGQYELRNPTQIFNEADLAKPMYKIYGEGICEFEVNGYILRANVGQNLIIDTERQLAYRIDGTIVNSSVSGNFEKLYLKSGKNEMKLTEGFELIVIPNWRCEY